MASYAENVSIWWRHHALRSTQMLRNSDAGSHLPTSHTGPPMPTPHVHWNPFHLSTQGSVPEGHVAFSHSSMADNETTRTFKLPCYPRYARKNVTLNISRAPLTSNWAPEISRITLRGIHNAVRHMHGCIMDRVFYGTGSLFDQRCLVRRRKDTTGCRSKISANHGGSARRHTRPAACQTATCSSNFNTFRSIWLSEKLWMGLFYSLDALLLTGVN